MNSSEADLSRQPRAAAWVSGGGEMGELIRTFDWARTPLGPLESWPQSLRSAVSILLPSKAQIVMFWGPDLIALYNDAYRPVFGRKHPSALGMPAREAWSELWDDLKPLFESVLQTGEAFWASDRYFYMERFGFPEETFFDVSYDPIRDETGNVGGLFCIVTETTARVIGERRLRTLRDLSLSGTAEARSVEHSCRTVAELLSRNQYDIPFALIYLLDKAGQTARLLGTSGLDVGTRAAPMSVNISPSADSCWPFYEVMQTNWPVEITDVIERCGELPGGVWPEPTHTAMVMPISASGQDRAAGFLVVGVSPRRPLDDQYRGFFDLLSTQIATTIANASAHEEERRRAEALAELDRAKTAFFSNVSHEFRTPLTLMLGPVADLLAETDDTLPSAQRERLEIAHRNGLRLQKLVNTLLDFSRIEAGRVQASFVPTDLASVTADLVSNFRSACEKAGLDLIVDCPPLPEPIYVDQDMWEKIVLNLVSNAFKFTLNGSIEVALRPADGHVALSVRDTGVGVPAEDLPKLFERFHRVRLSQGRTQEGSGIGLALVRELVKLHGGTVSVESTLGEGTVFTVSLPRGKDLLPQDHINAGQTMTSTALGAAPFVNEALRWLPKSSDLGQPALDNGFAPAVREKAAKQFRILLADDNADMRDYVSRLLADRYEVIAVGDGEAAWNALQQDLPDLFLSDVMMPVLDGFELLHRIRTDARTREIPVVLLSARAGEEARIEGLEAAADDYLVKPFSARELLATVDAHIKTVNIRRESQKALRASEERLREQDRRKDEFLATLAHELRNPLAPIRNGLYLMKLGLSDAATLEQARAIMDRQVHHMVRLVDDLMDVARISRNKIELRRELIDLDSIIRNALETSRPLIETGGHQLQVSLPSKPILLNADPVRLAQAFSNLLNNAAKYSERGGQIMMSAERQGDEVVLSIRDQGIGIRSEELPHIFDMFVQMDHSTERSQGGLGIGLTLVKRLIEMHGGTVEARSEGLGRGSEFLVRLPFAVTKSLADEQQPGIGDYAKRYLPARRILVVDDNVDAAESMAMMLRLLGHEVSTAHDGVAAIDMVEKLRPEVALLDLGMPKLDGYDAARHIRQQTSGKDVLLVAVTGWGQDEDRRRTKEAGFNLHLVKPIDLAALEKLLVDLNSSALQID